MAASFAKQNALGFASQSIGLVSNLIFNVIFPVFLGALIFGKLSVSLGFAYFLVGLFDFGFNQSCIRFVSKYYAEKNYAKVKYAFWRLFKTKLLVSLVIAALLLLSAPVLAAAYAVPELSVQLASALIILASALNFFTVFFTAVNKNYVSLLGAIINSSFLIILPLLAYFAGFRLNGIIAAVVLSFFAATVFLVLKALAELKKARSIEPVTGIERSVFGFSSVSFANVFALWGILLILGLFVSSDVVAFFKVSLSLVLAVISLVPISSSVAFSYFMQASSSREKLLDYTRKTLKYSLIIIVPAMFGLFLVGPKAVSVIYGPSYAQAGIALTWMCWAILPYFLNSILLSVLASLGKLRVASKIYTSSLAAGVASAFFLSPVFGLNGAAASFVFLNYLILALSLFAVRKEGVKIMACSYAAKPLIASLIMSVFVYFGLSFVSSLNSGIALVMGGIAVYFASLFFIK
ncbi:MAG: polysaccharide biosynthesis C-terminal domain-containing protein, partial [archaeon]